MRLWTRALGLAAALTAVSHSPVFAQGRRPSPELAREIALTRKAGLPVTAGDLRWRLPPADKNAALLYKKAWDLLARVPAEDARPIGELGRGTPPPARLAKVRRVLEAHRDVTELFERAASRPLCGFPRNWSKGPGVLFPEYAKFRDTARWLSGAACVQLVDGKPKDAVRTQSLGFSVAAHAAADPNLLSYLVGAAIDAITLNGLERILYSAGRNPRICDEVARGVVARQRLSLAHAMLGEVVTGMVAVDEARRGGMEGLRQLAGETGVSGAIPKGAARKPANWERLLDANTVYLLRAYRRAHAALGKPYPQAQAALRSLSAQVERDSTRHNSEAMLADIVLPVFEVLPARAAQVDARAACPRAGAAVLAWKDRHGSFPNRLIDAQNPPPPDPFGGGPLRYRREGNGFVVYSVGESGRFAGGKPTLKPGPREALFRYPRPAYLK